MSYCVFFFFKQRTAYEMRISDWSADVCSPDLLDRAAASAVTAFVANCGQTCSAGSRLLVQRSIRDAFVERMKKIIADTITIGPGVEEIGRAAGRERGCPDG